MKKLALILSISTVAAFASADTVITFDDLSGFGALAPGYGGVANWGNYNYYDAPQSPYTPASGAERAYVTYGTDSLFSFGQDVKFKGAYFSGYNPDNGGQQIYFDLYEGGNLVHTTAAISLSDVPTWMGSGYWGAVDAVRVQAVSGTNGLWVMDNVTYCGGAVPEPASMLALGGGLVAVLRRRKK